MQQSILIILMLQYATLVGLSIIVGGPYYALLGLVTGFIYVFYLAWKYTPN
uniref:Uncharacterized protein n=1 Tax=Octopus bimaculoides TaxID=37653 RepID=A0A0L8I9R2_OCTBM